VTTREFSILSATLLLEIFMGYGMVFALQIAPASEPESKPAPEAPSPVPEPLPVPIPVPLPSPIVLRNTEVMPQGQLANPPDVIKAVYLTSWSAGTKRMINYVIDLA
jgi:hypothetical protein